MGRVVGRRRGCLCGRLNWVEVELGQSGSSVPSMPGCLVVKVGACSNANNFPSVELIGTHSQLRALIKSAA